MGGANNEQMAIKLEEQLESKAGYLFNVCQSAVDPALFELGRAFALVRGAWLSAICAVGG